MDLARGNQPQPQERPTVTSAPAAATNAGLSSGRVLTILLSLASLVLIIYLGGRLLGGIGSDTAIKGKQYQALFLTNGQVYFGHVSKIDSSYVKMTDIYYLQVQQQVQPKQGEQQQQPQVSLAKLGGELHGPEDVMYVNRDQVLFWENLKNDGKVAKAISDYKAGGNK